MSLFSPTVFNGPYSAMSSEALKAAIGHFGISESFDDNGHRRWVIQIETAGPSSDRQQKAVFDQVRKCWRLSNDLAESRPSVSSSLLASPGISFTPDTKTLSQYASRANNLLESDQWTDSLPNTEHVDLFRSVKWSSTSVGDVKSWPRSLRLYTYMTLADRRAGVIYWGKDNLAIYNKPFIPLCGGKHPQFMGSSFRSTWPEVSDKFEALFTQLNTSETGITLSDYCLFLNRNGYTEETWWIGNLVPLRDDAGKFGGSFFSWNETTREVLTDRRTKLVNQIGAYSNSSNKTVWQHINDVFNNNSLDIPMAIMYSAEGLSGSGGAGDVLHLQATIGPDTNYKAAPPVIGLSEEKEGFGPVLRKARKAESDWLVQNVSSLPPEVTKNIDWRGFCEPSEQIVIIPVVVINKILKGFVIVGLNPRRSFDLDHQQFISELSRSLNALMSSTTTADQARQRETHLSKELADSERRIRRMAELAPMGMYDCSAEGSILWANSHFFDIVGTSSDLTNLPNFAFKDWIFEEDQEKAMSEFVKCIENKTEMSVAVRLKRSWRPPMSPDQAQASGGEEPVWILSQAYPHVEDGKVTSLMGCTLDISQFKWAESVQARTAEAAKKAKRMQEDFIDITSHEMRNPLSAVMQCADGILSSIQEYQQSPYNLEEILRSNVEAAESILLCASHQKRVIDDVLTLSKLDSDLLAVTPTAFQPNSVISEVSQMFKAEFTSSDIDARINLIESGNALASELVLCDPSRLMQILINLVSNAIKFTRSEQTREISIQYGGSDTPPQAADFGPGFQWCETKKVRRDLTTDIEYGQGNAIYLSFAVHDTGRGIQSDAAMHIFDKFIQASRRTHIKYGGSGLGLFISRELTEMQGGKIGVSSEKGIGSTFAFYVKAKKAVSLSLDRGTRKPQNGSSSVAKRHVNGMDSLATAMTTTPEGAQTPPVAPTPVSHCATLLLVEDNVVNQKVLAKQLRKVGCIVFVANHGGEAIDFLLHANGKPPEYGTARGETATVDCILMDLEMPICNGLTATTRIRELERDGGIDRRQLIVAITANARNEHIKGAMEAGMDAVMPKPFRVPELLAKIGQLIGRIC